MLNFFGYDQDTPLGQPRQDHLDRPLDRPEVFRHHVQGMFSEGGTPGWIGQQSTDRPLKLLGILHLHDLWGLELM